jgi:hypothetical protein
MTLSITVSSVIMLSVAFFIDVLSVVMLNVVMLSGVAPMSTISSKYFMLTKTLKTDDFYHADAGKEFLR